MDDLTGLQWSTSSDSTSNRATTHPFSGSRQASTPFPPRQTTPVSGHQSGNALWNKKAPPNGAASSPHDSFANLLSQSASKPQGALSMQERQRQLQAEKLKQNRDVYHVADNSVWEGLGSSGRGTPAPADQSKQSSTQPDDDLLSAFSASAHVDSSSHFPPPQQSNSTLSLPTQTYPNRDRDHSPASLASPNNTAGSPFELDDADDPFGLGQVVPKGASPAPGANVHEDDILGELGRPVTEIKPAPNRLKRNTHEGASSAPPDRALADLVDMGFALEKAQKALAQTETGTDVQAAVGVLLTQAHADSRGKSREQAQDRSNKSARGTTRRSSQGRNDQTGPAWMRKPATRTSATNCSPTAEERDVTQYASELGNTLFKSANTLWKSGQKKVQKAVAEFQQDTEETEPRWMQESQAPRPRPKLDVATSHPLQSTEEAMMLEGGRQALPGSTPRISQTPAARRNTHGRAEIGTAAPREARRAPPTTRPQPPSMQPSSRRTDRLTRQEAEQQSAQAYVSPARRRKPTPKPDYAPKPEATELALDIFSSTVQAPELQAKTSLPAASRTSNGNAKAPDYPTHSKASNRRAPDIAPGVLATCTKHRAAGGDAFRRGDYVSANSSYTSALSTLPKDHPHVIVLYCNRALTGLKIGDTKSAIDDANAALAIIGPSNGEGESISLEGGEGEKQMREFFGKALMRKAEALEHSEKWTEATKVWREAVHAGVGGAMAIQARNRCEKAALPVPANSAAIGIKQRAPPKKALSVRAKQSAVADLAGSSMSASADSEAVSRLRAANAAAAAASDEAFALTDSVEATLTAWKAGKADNLRALLASLDTVLWQGAGWQKVGMGDLVMPNRVKIIYMKAIAKVHPDKVPQNATTEQKMISAAVFATLNEAWDRFKKDNGL